ncbi:hypothetical protein Hanom_Chr11g00999651 [Helianthus anomalus]
MSSWGISYVLGEDLNKLYVSESVFRPALNEMRWRRLCLCFVVMTGECDPYEVEPPYVARSYPHHAYGTYHSHEKKNHRNEYEEGTKDFEEGDIEVEEGAKHFENVITAMKVLTTRKNLIRNDIPVTYVLFDIYSVY